MNASSRSCSNAVDDRHTGTELHQEQHGIRGVTPKHSDPLRRLRDGLLQRADRRVPRQSATTSALAEEFEPNARATVVAPSGRPAVSPQRQAAAGVAVLSPARSHASALFVRSCGACPQVASTMRTDVRAALARRQLAQMGEATLATIGGIGTGTDVVMFGSWSCAPPQDPPWAPARVCGRRPV